MAKIKCTVIVNTRNGYCLTPKEFDSVNKAKKYAKNAMGFAYRIFTEQGKIIRGYCCN